MLNHCSVCGTVCHFAPVDCISRLSGSVDLTLRYTTPDISCRHRRYKCDGGIKQTDYWNHFLGVSSLWPFLTWKITETLEPTEPWALTVGERVPEYIIWRYNCHREFRQIFNLCSLSRHTEIFLGNYFLYEPTRPTSLVDSFVFVWHKSQSVNV